VADKKLSIRGAVSQPVFAVPVGGVPTLKKQPGILKALDALLQDATAGDPIAGLKWTRKTSCKVINLFLDKA
jgi:hypothetical protein